MKQKIKLTKDQTHKHLDFIGIVTRQGSMSISLDKDGSVNAICLYAIAHGKEVSISYGSDTKVKVDCYNKKGETK